MRLYYTVAGPGTAEQTIERSRFITFVSPANSREEAEAFIRSISAEHKDATHNVPAMVIGDKMQIQWASDDGEPQGTSGAPMVKLLVSQGITNVVIVVTRYFGGIKLGTGGLVRAYTSSAKIGLEAAGIASAEQKTVITFAVDYSTYNKVASLDTGGRAALSDIRYTDKVTFDAACEPDDEEWLKGMISGASNGKAEVVEIRTEIVKISVDKSPVIL